MEELIVKLAELLEVEELDTTKKFSDYDEWDSLALLSVLAMLDSDYGVSMSGSRLKEFANIGEFCNFVLSSVES